MLRLAQGIAFALVLFLAGFGPLAGSARADQSVADMLADKVLGDPKAPVTIVEYASLGCPHCRHFHDETLPKIKKAYIDTGKAKLIFRDFPLGQRAMAAAMIARCAGPVRYFGMVAIMFRDQGDWGRAKDGLAALEASAKKGGMSAAQVQDCIRNEALLQGMQQGVEKAQKDHGVNATPTFIVGEERVEGAESFEEFSKIIDRALK